MNKLCCKKSLVPEPLSAFYALTYNCFPVYEICKLSFEELWTNYSSYDFSES